MGQRNGNLESILLLDDPFVLVTRPGELPEGPFPTAELNGASLVGYPPSVCQEDIENGLRACGADPTFVFRTLDNGAQVAMVKAGMGWAVMPLMAINTRDPEVDLRSLSPAIPPRQICLVWRRDRTLSPSRRGWSTSPPRSPPRSASSRCPPDVRFVVIGAGAVGGVVGGRMAEHGHDVVLVARGAHREAIAERGLTVEWPEGSVTLHVPVAAHPAELSFGDGDIVLVAVKSQDTAGVVEALAGSAPPETPIVCVQNGVANEPAFLRRFERVLGVPVMAPTSHLQPGLVQAHTRRAAAIFDVGLWPSGVDPLAEDLAAAFRASGFESVARPDIARWKYSKLLMNLGNPVDALCPRDDDARRLVTMAREEGERVLAAAGSTT